MIARHVFPQPIELPAEPPDLAEFVAGQVAQRLARRERYFPPHPTALPSHLVPLSPADAARVLETMAIQAGEWTPPPTDPALEFLGTFD